MEQTQDATPEAVLALANDVRARVALDVDKIRSVTGHTKMLAINALIEAARAGSAGRGFAIVAEEVKRVSGDIETVSQRLHDQVLQRMGRLAAIGDAMRRNVRGRRLIDLAANAIEIMDRNLYERTCDVRWWATDAAIVDAAAQPDDRAAVTHASRRMGVILDAYTVYLDLWLIDPSGRVLASGRPNRRRVAGLDVSGRGWFSEALRTRDGDSYAVGEVAPEPGLGGAVALPYATAVRREGARDGAPTGVLAALFDWDAQAGSVVRGVRMPPDEAARTRVMLVDRAGVVLAASDGKGALSERVALPSDAGKEGFFALPDGRIMGHALTPGFETYAGLGWRGVIVQAP
jgi:hypothetical protein